MIDKDSSTRFNLSIHVIVVYSSVTVLLFLLPSIHGLLCCKKYGTFGI